MHSGYSAVRIRQYDFYVKHKTRTFRCGRNDEVIDSGPVYKRIYVILILIHERGQSDLIRFDSILMQYIAEEYAKLYMVLALY